MHYLLRPRNPEGVLYEAIKQRPDRHCLIATHKEQRVGRVRKPGELPVPFPWCPSRPRYRKPGKLLVTSCRFEPDLAVAVADHASYSLFESSKRPTQNSIHPERMR